MKKIHRLAMWAAAAAGGWAVAGALQEGDAPAALAVSPFSILQGVGGSANVLIYGWHGSPDAVDINWDPDPGGYTDADAAAYFWGQGRQIYSAAFDHYSPGNCSGVDIYHYEASDASTYAGAQQYVHITEGKGVIGSTWYTNADESLYTRSLGKVSGGQDASCPWSAPHLHQAEDFSCNSLKWRNPAIPTGGDNSEVFASYVPIAEIRTYGC